MNDYTVCMKFNLNFQFSDEDLWNCAEQQTIFTIYEVSGNGNEITIVPLFDEDLTSDAMRDMFTHFKTWFEQQSFQRINS